VAKASIARKGFERDQFDAQQDCAPGDTMNTNTVAAVSAIETTIAAAAVETAAAVPTTTATKKVVKGEGKSAAVETAPEAAAAKAEVEKWACSITGEMCPIDKLLVPKLGDLDKELGRRTTEADLRVRAISAKGGLQKGINRDDLMHLDFALNIVRTEEARASKKAELEAKETARLARIKEDADFRKSVYVGKPLAHPRTGKVHVRCVQAHKCEYALEKGTAFVGSIDVMQAPSLEDMQAMNYEDKRGRAVNVSHLMTHYVLCPQCAANLIVSPQSVAKAEEEILADLEINGEAYAQEEEQARLRAAYYNGPQAQTRNGFNRTGRRG